MEVRLSGDQRCQPFGGLRAHRPRRRRRDVATHRGDKGGRRLMLRSGRWLRLVDRSRAPGESESSQQSLRVRGRNREWSNGITRVSVRARRAGIQRRRGWLTERPFRVRLDDPMRGHPLCRASAAPSSPADSKLAGTRVAYPLHSWGGPIAELDPTGQDGLLSDHPSGCHRDRVRTVTPS